VATTADATSKTNSERMNDIAKRLQDNTNELSKRITELERIQNSTIGGARRDQRSLDLDFRGFNGFGCVRVFHVAKE